MAFDIDGAKKSGYSDQEIADYLSGKSDFDVQGALSSGYSPEEIVSYLSSKEKKPEYNTALQGVRQVGQGLTFGLSDEVQSGISALIDSVGSDQTFSEAYDRSQEDLRRKREAFEEDNEALAMGLELAGGLLTGGAGAARVLGSQAVRNAPTLGRALAGIGTGAAEGAIYGAGTADAGERLQGAAEGGGYGALGGAVAAPIANIAGRALGAGANRLASLATDTPTGAAKRVIRDTANATGLTPDEAVKRMRELGPDAVLADLDEGTRMIARAGANRMGPMREQAQKFVIDRDRAQNQRLLSTIEAAAGSSKSFANTQKNIVQQRQEQAGPLYDLARRKGLELTPDLREIVKNVNIQGAANKLASLSGRPPLKAPTITVQRPAGRFQREGTTQTIKDPNATIFDDMTPQDRFDYLKFAKEGLSDMIGKAAKDNNRNQMRILMEQKDALVAAMGRQNEEYIRANSIFSSASELNDALVSGRTLMSNAVDADEVAEMLQGMTKTEQDMFRLGAVRSVADKLERLGANRDLSSVIGPGAPPAVQKKIALVMGDDAPEFLRRAGVEENFAETKRAVTGNSTTELQKQIGESLDQMIDPGFMREIANSNRSNIVGKVVDLFSRKQATPEIVEQLGNILFKQGYNEKQIRNIFGGSGVRRALGDDYDAVVGPFISGMASSATAIGNLQE